MSEGRWGWGGELWVGQVRVGGELWVGWCRGE